MLRLLDRLQSFTILIKDMHLERARCYITEYFTHVSLYYTGNLHFTPLSNLRKCGHQSAAFSLCNHAHRRKQTVMNEAPNPEIN